MPPDDDGDNVVHLGKKSRKLRNPPAGVVVISPSAPLVIAQIFLDHTYGDPRRAKLIRHRGGFYQWNGSSWSDNGEEPLRAELYEYLAGCFRPAKQGNGIEPVQPNIKLVTEVLSALRALALIAYEIEPPVWLGDDQKPPHPKEIVAFKNGLLHLPTLELISPTPEFFNLTALGVAWDENAEKPSHWFDFLQQLWPDDSESINTLQQIFGYCLTPETRLQKAFMIIGPPRSGKGTIGRVLGALVTSANTASPTLSGLSRQFGRQSLIGKTLALIGDARVGWDTDPVAIAEHLLSITGEDQVTVERKNKPDWIGKLTIKFLVLCTELPTMTDDSAGIASRFIVLRLISSFLGKEDQELTTKLLRELPGIAVWAVAGWQALFGKSGGKINQPKSAQGYADDLQDLVAVVKNYLDERCDFNPNYFIRKTYLYEDHCSWRTTRGFPSITQKTFGAKLRAAFPGLDDYRPRADVGSQGEIQDDGTAPSDSNQDNKRPRHYRGLRLQSP